MADVLSPRVEALLAPLVGQPCLGVLHSARPDWAFVLDLGARRRRTLRLANPRLSFLQRTHEGSHGLVVETTWRLQSADEVLASCFDEPPAQDPAGPAPSPLERLVDRRVERAEAQGPGWDLRLSFEGGLELVVFSTETHDRTRRGNWSAWSPAGLVSVEAWSRVVCRTLEEVKGEADREAEKDVPVDEDVVELWRQRWRQRGRRVDDESE